LGDIGEGERTFIRMDLEARNMWVSLRSTGPREGSVERFCKHGNEHWGFIERRQFLDELRDHQFFNKLMLHGFGRLFSWESL
jgi:hypothetical protein